MKYKKSKKRSYKKSGKKTYQGGSSTYKMSRGGIRL